MTLANNDNLCLLEYRAYLSVHKAQQICSKMNKLAIRNELEFYADSKFEFQTTTDCSSTWLLESICAVPGSTFCTPSSFFIHLQNTN